MVLPPAQPLQRGHHLAAHPVQSGHQFLLLGGKREAVPLGVHVPGLLPDPGASPNVPSKDIVFQQVPLLLPQAGEASFQIAEHLLIGVLLRHCSQSRGDQGQYRLLQNVHHGAEVDGDAVLGEHTLHQLPVGLQLPGADHNVPASHLAPAEEPHNLRGSPLHLLAGGGRLGSDHPAFLLPELGQGAVEVPLQPGQGGMVGPGTVQGLLRHPGPALSGQGLETPCRPAGGGKNLLRVMVPVTHQGHRHICLGHQAAQHLLLLGGKISEAIDPDLRPLGPSRLLQLIRQQIQSASGIRSPLGSQGLIGPIEQTDVPPLVPLLASQLLPCFYELGGEDTAALTLVHRLQDVGEEGGLPGGGGVQAQTGGALAQGGIHQQHPPASVQHRGGSTPCHIPNPSGQTGKGENLAYPGSPRPQHLAHGPLTLVRVLLRHQQQSPGGPGTAEPLQQLSTNFMAPTGIQ